MCVLGGKKHLKSPFSPLSPGSLLQPSSEGTRTSGPEICQGLYVYAWKAALNTRRTPDLNLESGPTDIAHSSGGFHRGAVSGGLEKAWISKHLQNPTSSTLTILRRGSSYTIGRNPPPQKGPVGRVILSHPLSTWKGLPWNPLGFCSPNDKKGNYLMRPRFRSSLPGNPKVPKSESQQLPGKLGHSSSGIRM